MFRIVSLFFISTLICSSMAYSQTIPFGTAPIEKVNRSDALQGAEMNNPELQAAKYARQSAEFIKYSKWSRFAPSLDAGWSKDSTSSVGATSESTAYSLKANINLFEGFRGVSAVKSGSLTLQSAKLRESESALALRRDVNIAYNTVIKTGFLLKSARSMLESANIVYEESQERQRLDIISRADFYKAQADNAKAAATALDAEVNHTVAIKELVRLTGLPMDVSTTFAEDDVNNHLFTLEEYMDAAMQYNISVQQSEIDTNLAWQNLYSARGGFLPTLNASAGSSWNETDTIRNDYNVNYVGLSANWNLFNGFYDTFQSIAASKDLQKNRLLNVAAKDALIRQVTELYNRAKISESSIMYANEYFAASQESFKATQEAFRLGRATLKETIDARATLEDAIATVANTTFNKNQAHEELYFITGGMIQNNVE